MQKQYYYDQITLIVDFLGHNLREIKEVNFSDGYVSNISHFQRW